MQIGEEAVKSLLHDLIRHYHERVKGISQVTKGPALLLSNVKDPDFQGLYLAQNLLILQR